MKKWDICDWLEMGETIKSAIQDLAMEMKTQL